MRPDDEAMREFVRTFFWELAAHEGATPEEIAQGKLEDHIDLKIGQSIGHMIPMFHAAIDAYEKAMWRPIEEAPKDGTAVLVYAPPLHGLPSLTTIAAYHQDAGWCVCELREATHFRPLPQPPEQKP